ncbi:SagB/ThcOx family dehydrogenase [Granulosicoccus sp. 3-233]|uniref:SagB/ThcOx family dehydrogenase n=1 Tax=Granulosicoccus sp. 3-233 TaxID=3417969 RepID=UPI003D337757
MSTSTLCWQYSLTRDIASREDAHGIVLQTSAGQHRVATGGNTHIRDLLVDERISEEQLQSVLSAGGDAGSAASILYQLDRLGALDRHLSESDRQLASCLALRAAPSPWPQCLPEGRLRLSRYTIAHRTGGCLCLENPGQWANLELHDRALSGLLHDLSVGLSAQQIITRMQDLSAQAMQAILRLFDWCGLLHAAQEPPGAAHERLFHTRTRAGYTQRFPGRSTTAGPTPFRSDTLDERLESAPITRLDRPARKSCNKATTDYATVISQRRSIREQGKAPITSGCLAEFLFRTVGEQQGRRNYPSGGSCYSIKTYVAIRQCRGIRAGLYLYEPFRHELVSIAHPGTSLTRLLAGAARTADITIPPQVLLVLACDFSLVHGRYPELGYALALKEVGAIYQLAMSNAAAMELASCPLGCGDSLLFSELLGVDSQIETSIGELMLGSMPDHRD